MRKIIILVLLIGLGLYFLLFELFQIQNVNSTNSEKDNQDLLNGRQLTYYDNGQVKEVYNYELGNREGVSISYYETGEVFSLKYYERDSSFYIKRFSENGDLIWYAVAAEVNKVINGDTVYINAELPYSNLDNKS